MLDHNLSLPDKLPNLPDTYQIIFFDLVGLKALIHRALSGHLPDYQIIFEPL